MFEKDITITGRHATHMKALSDAGVFRRYIDVYMVGAIWGLLYDHRVERDNESSDEAKILAGTVNAERIKCESIYRLAMLLDKSVRLSAQQQIDKAFRYDDSYEDVMRENLLIFHSYVYGGIEKLYEKFVTGCTTKDDYIDAMHKVVTDFKKDLDGSCGTASVEMLGKH